MDAVVFHQLCTVYQHLRGDVIYCLTLEKTQAEQSAERMCTEGAWQLLLVLGNVWKYTSDQPEHHLCHISLVICHFLVFPL